MVPHYNSLCNILYHVQMVTLIHAHFSVMNITYWQLIVNMLESLKLCSSTS